MSRLEKVLRELEGATILYAVLTAEDEGDPPTWISFVLELKDGQQLNLTVSSDEEGNGPGALLGLWDLARSKGI